MFGAATMVFGASTNFMIAMLALVVIGVFDTLTSIIRNTIRQSKTPDYLRGHMNNLNLLFFMPGPQLGKMETVTVAQFFGAPFALISGGFLCIVGVGWVAKRWPQLRRYQGNEPSIEPTPS